MRFGLEFVGPETARIGPKAMGPNEFIWTLPQTMDLIGDINAPADNVGLLLDSFHWFCTGSNLSEIENLRAQDVVHVHINDAPDRPLSEQMDFERLLPGDGVIRSSGNFQRRAQGNGNGKSRRSYRNGDREDPGDAVGYSSASVTLYEGGKLCCNIGKFILELAPFRIHLYSTRINFLYRTSPSHSGRDVTK
jgi:hypothetical protein